MLLLRKQLYWTRQVWDNVYEISSLYIIRDNTMELFLFRRKFISHSRSLWKNMDIVSINFKCAWEMSQKCTSTTCAFKTYYDILVCINFRAADEKEEGELNAKSTTKSVWIIPSSAFWCWSGTRHLTSKKSSSSTYLIFVTDTTDMSV